MGAMGAMGAIGAMGAMGAIGAMGALGPWEPWGPCTAKCGGGGVTRGLRSYVSLPTSRTANCGDGCVARGRHAGLTLQGDASEKQKNGVEVAACAADYH